MIAGCDLRKILKQNRHDWRESVRPARPCRATKEVAHHLSRLHRNTHEIVWCIAGSTPDITITVYYGFLKEPVTQLSILNTCTYSFTLEKVYQIMSREELHRRNLNIISAS